MLRRINRIFICFCFSALIAACSKNEDNTPAGPDPATTLSYGDSILYQREQATDYIVPSNQTAAGRYTAFPEDIEIDEVTGAINVSKSESGLRYRITFKPSNSPDSISTIIVISGINFLDGFYKLGTADSIVKPLYNASRASAIPGTNSGSVFDEGSGCNSAGCNVDLALGTINLAQTVRNGVFGSRPANDERREFQLNYRINDKSNKALIKLKVKLYYYDSIADVPQDIYDLIASRDGTILRTMANGRSPVNYLNRPLGKASPRPPCIFILAH